MVKSNTMVRENTSRSKITKKEFKRMIPLEAPKHVGMNAFPHLFIQIVEVEGESMKILWDFSSLKNADEIKNKNAYPWEFDYIVNARISPKRKSTLDFMEYQKNGTVIAIQV